MTSIALILAALLYAATIYVFTCGLLWRHWLIMIGSVVPGGITVLLASASSSLWLRLLDGLGGIGSAGSFGALASVLVMSLCIAMRALTSDAGDSWAMRLAGRAETAIRLRVTADRG